MHSFLIISSDPLKGDTYIQQLCEKHEITLLDRISLNTEGSVGIKDIRELQAKLLLKPYQSPTKAIIINHADTMTLEAQNAFLKTLEEPPDQTILFLLAESLEVFLPTVLSRCKIVILDEVKKEMTHEERIELDVVFTKISSEYIGEKLFFAQEWGKSKGEATKQLEKCLLYLRELLLTSDEASEESILVISLIERFQEIYEVIKNTNISPRLALEELFLTI